MKNILGKIGLVISGLSSPFLIIPLFSLITISHHSPNIKSFLLFGSIFVGFTVMLPLAYILTAVKTGKISDIHVAIKEQRAMPFLLAIVGSILTLFAFYLLHAPTPLLAMTYALFVNGIIFALLTTYWKISIHSASFASSITIAGLLVSSNYFWLYPLIILIFWARLARKRHNIWQLLAATVLSPLITALVLALI